jgi:hypothetical protein
MLEKQAIALAKASLSESETKLIFKRAFKTERDGRSIWVIAFARPTEKNRVIFPQTVFIGVDERTAQILRFDHI